ncbi:cytochrome P450 [Dentipellis sp. KUC8613]|nr:cytochrome P450 [Dentipellis sp. KUC8613]
MFSFYSLALPTAILIVVAIISSLRRRTLPFPPGPPCIPLIGNYLSLPARQPWITYAEWSKTFCSDVISLQAFGRLSIIVNTKEAAKELLECRSAKYSDRPFPVMTEIMGWAWATSLMPYSNAWRVRRRLLHETFHTTAALTYRPHQRAEVHKMLQRLRADPQRFALNLLGFASMAASIAMTIAYGVMDPRESDRFLHLAEASVSMFSNAVFPGAAVVNALPFLRHLPAWLPGMGFKPYAQKCSRLAMDMRDLPWEFFKKGMADKYYMKDDGEQAMKDACAVTYAGTVSALSTSVLALFLHPAVQRRAQQEIDRVVGRQRLPAFEDRDGLPYIEAVYREILRWKPVTPLSVFRAVLEDDVYEGHFIPKGTEVFANVWAMTHDPAEYPDPEAFIPERFLQPEGTLNGDDMRIVFGFGRRFCSGQHLADATLWMTIVSILAVFNLDPAKDEKGENIVVKAEYTDGMIRCVLKNMLREFSTRGSF